MKRFQKIVIGIAVGLLLAIAFFVARNVPSGDNGRYSVIRMQKHGSNPAALKEFDIGVSNLNGMIKGWDEMQEQPIEEWTPIFRNYSMVFRAWEKMTATLQMELYHDKRRLNQQLFPWIKNLQSDPLAIKKSSMGRGIVIPSGNGQFDYTFANIQYLRFLGCVLPIEVHFIGDNDLSKENRNRLMKLKGVRTVDVFDYVVDEVAHLGGWAIKPFAMLFSSFDEVLMLDADVVFLEDPTILFEEPKYLSYGCLFYTDRTLFPTMKKREFLEKILPAPLDDAVTKTRWYQGSSSHEMESGVVLYNKKERFLGLLGAAMLNIDRLRGKMYQVSFGDKETFWLGAAMMGERFTFAEQPAGIIGPEPVVHETFMLCSVQLLHVDEENGRPLWFNQWIYKSKFDKSLGFEKFLYWAIEPAQMQLQEANRVCFVPTVRENDEVIPVKRFDRVAPKHIERLMVLRQIWTDGG